MTFSYCTQFPENSQLMLIMNVEYNMPQNCIAALFASDPADTLLIINALDLLVHFYRLRSDP